MVTHRRHEDGTRIRIRTRASTNMQAFDAGDHLEVNDARFDKLELSRVYTLSDVPFDYDSPAELARALVEEHRPIVPNRHALEECCSALNFRSSGANSGEGTVNLELGRTTAGGARWLVSVGVEFRWAQRPRAREDFSARPAARLHVTVTVNPTRLSAHAAARDVDVESAAWHQILTSDFATYERVAAHSVNMRQDNVLPIGVILQLVARERTSLEHTVQEVALYASKIDALLEHLVGVELRGTRVSTNAWFAPATEGWTVRQAEIYWEFGKTSAIEFVRRLRPVLWSISNDVGERSWAIEDGMEAVAYTMRATEKIRLAVYAKTVDRIRLEVRYSKGIPGNMNDPLPNRLRRVIEDASDRANSARDAIRRRRAETTPVQTLPESVDALCELVLTLTHFYRSEPEKAGDVLRLLLTRGGVRTRGEDFSLTTREAQALKRIRVLESSRLGSASSRDNFYPIAARFVHLYELFVGTSVAPLRGECASDA